MDASFVGWMQSYDEIRSHNAVDGVQSIGIGLYMRCHATMQGPSRHQQSRGAREDCALAVAALLTLAGSAAATHAESRAEGPAAKRFHGGVGG